MNPLNVFWLIPSIKASPLATSLISLDTTLAGSIIPATMRIPYKKLFGFVSVAGLIGNASYSKKGLMPSGYAYTSGSRTMAKGESYSMGGVEGLFLFQDIASYAHWHVMFKAKGVLLDLSNKSFGYLKLSTDGNNLVVTNIEGGAARQFTIIYQNVSLFAK